VNIRFDRRGRRRGADREERERETREVFRDKETSMVDEKVTHEGRQWIKEVISRHQEVTDRFPVELLCEEQGR